jgi:hypothetical protein
MDYTDLGDVDFEDQAIAGPTARTVDYTHDQSGNRLSLTYPGGTALTYEPTALNQVAEIGFGSQLVNYAYYGNRHRLLSRRTATGVSSTVYETRWDYDSHRRIDEIRNNVEPGGVPQTVVQYDFTHDANGNPLSRTAGGDPAFATDDRTFTIDALTRATRTATAWWTASTSSRSSRFSRAGSASEYDPLRIIHRASLPSGKPLATTGSPPVPPSPPSPAAAGRPDGRISCLDGGVRVGYVAATRPQGGAHQAVADGVATT